ncbi:Protein FAM86A [Dufourea novaeangliae]|uniref:Protein FAM86A n=2 Tax=Dufourea novaeangliae TaxID=178035 RepID=A0A154P7B2_DUFNO|nr:Protein FAM86A [Dufourea novaeangliae]
MNKIEEEGSEIHDDLYIAYCNLISNPISELIHHRHFLIGDISDCISIQESTNIISDATTGLCCWQGAIELSKWCIENKSAFHDKVVLELGCGVGLTGVCIIKNCSPNQYIFTDFHKSVLEMVCENVKLNLLNMEQTVEVKQLSESNRLKFQTKYNNTDVQVVKLNWEDINKYLDEYWTVPDIIIGADILYDTYSFNALALGLKAFLSFNGRYAVIAAAIRNVDTFSKFLHFLKSHGLSYEECSTPTQTVLLQEIHIPVKIIKICRKT